MQLPQLIPSGTHKDNRGTLTFFNELDLSAVKRMYWIEHPDTSIVRAWQGHKIEQKWFLVTEGSFKIVLVVPDNWDNPSGVLSTEEFLLSASEAAVLHIPGGYASGFKALEPNSKMLVFADATVEATKADDYRFKKELWYGWNEEEGKK